MPQHTALDLRMLYQLRNPGAPSRSTFQQRMKKSLSMHAVGKHSKSNCARSRKRNTLALARTVQFAVHPSFYLITWKWLVEWIVDWLVYWDAQITPPPPPMLVRRRSWAAGCSTRVMVWTFVGMRLMCLIGYETRNQCGMISKSKLYILITIFSCFSELIWKSHMDVHYQSQDWRGH